MLCVFEPVFFFFFLWWWGETGSHITCPDLTQTCYVAKDNLELPALQPLPSKCWDCSVPGFLGPGGWIQGLVHAG